MKILVIGGAGMLGHQCFLKLRKSFGIEQVGCTLRKNRAHYAKLDLFSTGPVFDGLDVSSFGNLENCLNTFQPQVIVNCIGLTLRKPEMADYDKALEINAMLPHRLALWGLNHKARVIHFSTDCVFDGGTGGYTELHIPTAKDHYGKTKFLGEISYPNSLTLRLSIVGRELEGKTELIEWFLSQKGKTVGGYSEVLYSGLTTNYVADEVIRLIRHFPQLSGLYQASSEPISKYDLLNIVNRTYDTKTFIEKNDKYKSNKVLLCDKYQKATGFQKPSWTHMIEKMKEEESVNYGN